MRNMVMDMEERAKETGVEFQAFDAVGPNDFDGAFEAMVKAREGALMVFPSPMFYVNHRRLVDLAALHQLPTMYAFREAVEAGGLISYGADIPDLARRGAKYVAKILKGAKPGDLPVEQPTRFELLINLKTAKSLGLTVPPTLLAGADEVIE
jgi:putative tryptophan/tyrosine transport system substrate-binding protein